MSDDPIKDLEDFNQQGLNVNPLPPSEVRRLGDRMRRRNAAFAAVGAAAAIAVIVTPLAVFAGGRDHAEPPVTNQSVSPSVSPSESPSSPVSVLPRFQTTSRSRPASTDRTWTTFRHRRVLADTADLLRPAPPRLGRAAWTP